MSGIDVYEHAFTRGFLPVPPNRSPPWTLRPELVEKCTRCGNCAAACPGHVIVMTGSGPAELDFVRGECSFCGECARSCPQSLFDLARPITLRARIGDGCLALLGVHCRACSERCDAQAIRFQARLRRPPQPVLDPDLCTGCGACVAPCPVGVVLVSAEEASE
jgi:ferredoxin-type protein NapF